MKLLECSMEFDGFNGTIAGCNHSRSLKARCRKAQALGMRSSVRTYLIVIRIWRVKSGHSSEKRARQNGLLRRIERLHVVELVRESSFYFYFEITYILFTNGLLIGLGGFIKSPIYRKCK